MENQQSSTKKIALNYGLLLGFASVLMSVALYAMGKTLDRDWKTTTLGILLILVFVVLGIRAYKNENNGFLTLGQGLKTGVGIALIAAVISVIYTVIFAKFIEPDFINQVVESQRETMLDNPNSTEEQIERMEKGTRDYFYVFTIGVIFIFNLFLGFVFSLISSLVMKRTEE